MIPHGGYVQISVLKSVKVISPKIYNEMWSIEGWRSAEQQVNFITVRLLSFCNQILAYTMFFYILTLHYK